MLSIALSVKERVSQLQLKASYSTNERARLLDVPGKQLEDFETVRDYGCHSDLKLLAKIKVIYKTSMD